MRKKLTREEYAKKFINQMMKLNYIPQEGEIVKQCISPYPDFWFVSNMAYVFSVYNKNVKILKMYYRKTGKKNKDGERAGKDWYYIHSKTKHVSTHKLIADHFLNDEFDNGLEVEEIHHKKKVNSFKPNEGQFCNRATNLQVLPKEIHQQLTNYSKDSNEEYEKKTEKDISLTENQIMTLGLQAISSALENGGKPYVMLKNDSASAAFLIKDLKPLKNKSDK